MKYLLNFVLFGIASHNISAIRRHPSDFIQHRNLLDSDGDGESIIESAEHLVENITGRDRRLESDSINHDLPTPFDHIVTSMPYLEEGAFSTPHYAGHIPASVEDDKKFFYWLFEPDITEQDMNDEDIPLLIWLNGGPGCSSMDGLWLENGPFRLTSPSGDSDDWTIQINPYSWHKAPAYLLYIDQPVGTGLSFTKNRNYCQNDQQVNRDFHIFLQNFLKVYSQFFLKDQPEIVQTLDGKQKERYSMSRPLYFSGESHAGHYIPSMMDYILQKNDVEESTKMPHVLIDVKGGAIGNGWVNPYYQYSAAEVAFGVGSIDLAQKEEFDREEIKCRKMLNSGKLASHTCFELLDKIIDQSHGQSGRSKVSMYDNRMWEKRGQARSFPPGHKNVERYLGGWSEPGYPSDMTVDYQDVLRALHADESIVAKQRFQECTDPPYNALAHQDGLGVVDEVVRILNHRDKPRLLFFNGMNDMICNHVGNEKVLDNLPWEKQKDWTLAKRYAWDAHRGNVGEPSGYMKEYSNLLFLKLRSSGHMVPMDVPDVALIMMRTFLYSGSFSSSLQNLNSAVQDSSEHCDCPACEDGNGEDYYEVGEDEMVRKVLRTETIKGGWLGAIAGISVSMLYIFYRDQQRPRPGSRTKVTHDAAPLQKYKDEPENYPETEMI